MDTGDLVGISCCAEPRVVAEQPEQGEEGVWEFAGGDGAADSSLPGSHTDSGTWCQANAGIQQTSAPPQP